jgi:hypothetical protein
MKRRVESQLPRARKEQLLVQELSDELLIYDLERHKAYCLNQTAARIWRSCNGRRTVTEMARVLTRELGSPVDESLIWFSLEQLSRSWLLEEQIESPALNQRLTRRELARTLGVATAALLPFITSVTAPTAAQAATCGAVGSPCANNARCCSTLCINGTCACLANQSDCDTTQPQQCCSGRCGSASGKCLP